MRYSIEPKRRRYVKGYGFLSFARNLNKKYGQKLVDSAEKSATGVSKIASKGAIQKTAEATGDLIGNTIANKITSISKKPSGKPHPDMVNNEIPIERYISLSETQKLLMN